MNSTNKDNLIKEKEQKLKELKQEKEKNSEIIATKSIIKYNGLGKDITKEIHIKRELEIQIKKLTEEISELKSS